MINWNKPQKLSPGVIVINIINILQTLWPFAIVILANMLFDADENKEAVKKDDTDFSVFYIVGGFMLMFIIRSKELLQYFTTTYYCNNQNLIIKQKFLTTKEVIIPFNKIQNINLSQTVLHKITETVKVEINTAGSDRTEGILPALKPTVAHALKNYLLKEHTDDVNIEPKETIKANHVITIKQLLKLAFTENHLKTFFIILSFIFNKIDDAKRYLKFDTEAYIKNNSNDLQFSLNNILIAISITLFITLMVSLVRLFFKFGNFSYVKEDKNIKLQWGIIENHQQNIALKNIKQISTKANWLRNKLDIQIITLFVKGRDSGNVKKLIQIPALSNNSTLGFITENYLPSISNNTINKPYTISKKYFIRKAIIVSLLSVIIITLLQIIHYSNYNWLFIATVIIPILVSYTFYKKFNYYIWLQGIEVNKGVWGNERTFIKYEHIEHVEVRVSLYQKKHNLCSMHLHTAGEIVKIHYIPQQLGYALTNYILAKQTHYKTLQGFGF
jgi:putative membrane protein